MQSYTVQSPMHRDGKRIDVGGRVELDDATAAPLLAAGCIAPADAEPKPNAKGKGK